MKRSGKIRKLNHDADFKTWFEGVYQDHFERLFRYAYTITKDQQMAEDVVSEVFTNIWHKKPDYNTIKELSSYLRVSVKHLAIRTVSKDPGKFTYSTYDETLQVSDAIDPEDILLGQELKQIVDTVLNNLTPHSKLVYDMARNKGMTYEQIAQELGISKKTVESHMYNVLKKIKEALQKHFKDSGVSYPYFTNIGSIAGLIATAVAQSIH